MTEEITNQEILSLDDIYFKDAFTKTEDQLNLEIDNANIKCITSKDNKFSLDSDGNLIVKSITAETFNIQNIFDAIYPVGSAYVTFDNTNPSTLFGGVWEQVKDTFLLCAGDKYPAGTTGGEAEHTLTVDEMPNHNHNITVHRNAGAGTMLAQSSGVGGSVVGPWWLASKTGGDKPHNNMPPYQTVYVWKRIS